MTLTIECECGNKVTMSVQPKKYLQLRDNLETRQFRYGGAEIKNEKVEEFRICCDKKAILDAVEKSGKSLEEILEMLGK